MHLNKWTCLQGETAERRHYHGIVLESCYQAIGSGAKVGKKGR